MKYNILASLEDVKITMEALAKNSVEALYVENGDEALQKIKELIPKSASVMNGSSVTLEQIGFVDYLKSANHGWNNIHEGIVKETDKAKQSILRKQATLSDYYLGSVHALIINGEFIIASNTGSQLPNIVYSSPNLIFVVSTKKIVKTLDDAMKRLEEYVYPLEDQHMKQKGAPGSAISKVVIFKRENPMMGRKVRMILVNQDLGF